MTIKAIETQYAGCRFRSRLEARWAVFFDILGIPWEYEPQGYELPTGRYLPDFFLPSINTWYEVKGVEPTEREQALALELEEATDKRVVIAWGQIPRSTDCMGYGPGTSGGWPIPPGGHRIDTCFDQHYAWCVCPWCDKFGLEFEGRSARICGWHTHQITEEQARAAIADNNNCWRIDDKCYTADDPRIQVALVEARSARFEHGESGTPATRGWPDDVTAVVVTRHQAKTETGEW